MKAIEKSKHTNLLNYLEELRSLTTDLAEVRRITRDIEVLMESYNCYRSLLDDIKTQTVRYNELHDDIRIKTYRQLRDAKQRAEQGKPVNVPPLLR